MNKPKRITGLTIAEAEISQADFNSVLALAVLHQGHAWDTTPTGPLNTAEKKLVKSFKKKLKTSLFTRFQRSYCCYCAIKLPNHQAKYDLEHVIAKDGRSQVVFSLENLALSCGPCNTNKSNQKSTTSIGPDPDAVSTKSFDYLIVHPHHDEWAYYFQVDQFMRIVPKWIPDLKATRTIEICGIDKFNAIQIAEWFDWIPSNSKHHRDWITFYQELYGPIDVERGKKLAKFAKTLLTVQGDPASSNLYAVLRDRIDHLAAVQP
jgi:hypothetical protein